MTRVLLTGATGFIGSHVARLLVQEGVDVYALIRDGSDTRRIEDILPALHIVRGDLRTAFETGHCLQDIKADLCLHLAWSTKPGEYLSSPNNLDLLHQTAKLAQRLAEL